MTLQQLRIFLGLAGMGFWLAACIPSQEQPTDREVVYQVSTIDALLAGEYDGEVTYGQVRQHGDFGIGTFNALDGEMLELDGDVFQIKSDGKAYPVADSTKTPFAAVTYFEADTVVPLTGPVSFEQLCALIDSLIPSENNFYAIRIEGEFESINARSVPRQVRPYIPMVEIVKTQPTFAYERVQGTLMGFRTPPFMKGLNVPGYHLHFITHDRTRGGHVLACSVAKGTLSIDFTSGFHMTLPNSGSFHRIDLTQDKQAELEKVEK
ncbi:acetolactate decarboxylase [Salmonirosea aquatica]|uniref:Alpha-acetolactate decarboxylase n=1 Tax=Salmonirosea aquatica TaxID=2654236 RepID=A0A7C9BGE1_9BACT|nr:acetolactate decarboxylase [Cytophagaceae bacterium SJW1-29]